MLVFIAFGDNIFRVWLGIARVRRAKLTLSYCLSACRTADAALASWSKIDDHNFHTPIYSFTMVAKLRLNVMRQAIPDCDRSLHAALGVKEYY